jgi:hypothetical protein
MRQLIVADTSGRDWYAAITQTQGTWLLVIALPSQDTFEPEPEESFWEVPDSRVLN